MFMQHEDDPAGSMSRDLLGSQWYLSLAEVELLNRGWNPHKQLELGNRQTAFRTLVLAVYALIAWRVLFLTMQSREVPNMPCDILLELEEWQALYCYIHNTKTPPTQPPTLEAATRMIARLGGFLGRKGDGHPGATTIWRGLQRLQDIAAGSVSRAATGI